MTIKVSLYDTQTLIGVMRNLSPPTTYWLDLCYPNEIHFETEYVDFEQLSDVRRVAPFVMPLALGRPIYSEGSRVTRLKPAYIKPKDPVSPGRVLKKRPGTLADIGANQSPNQIYNSIISDILRAHQDAIWRRWEWLACRAAVDGSVLISGEAYPARLINFGRDSDLTGTLSSGAVWGPSNTVGPLDTVTGIQQLMRRSLFGGAMNRITMTPDAYELFRQSPSIVDLLKFGLSNFAGGLNPSLGVLNGGAVESVGSIGNGLPIYVYNDYYQDSTGAQVNYLDDLTAVFTGPNVQGYRCFGAILDPNAQFQALPIFPRMFTENDPPLTFVMTQSAPLMVPLNPNNTAKLTVAS